MNTMPASAQARGELRVLGQEPVARVDRLGAGLARRGEDRAAVEVGLRGRGGADAVRPRRPRARAARRHRRRCRRRPSGCRERRSVRMTRRAISPRLATSTVSKSGLVIWVTSGRRRSAVRAAERARRRRARGRAGRGCRPGRRCRRPTAARWRSTGCPALRTGRGSALRSPTAPRPTTPRRGASSWSRLTVESTDAACGPPMTEMRLAGHVHRNRGEYARPHIE